MSMRELTASVDIFSTRVSYSEFGQGVPYLALHGNPGSKRDFSGVLENSSSLSGAGRMLFLLDRPGHNGSEELISAEPNAFLDAETYARFIDLKCDGKAWLVGYSFGAYVALKVASMFPEKVKGLVLFSPYIMSEDVKYNSMPALSKNALLGTIFGIVKPLLAQKKALKRIEDAFYPEEPTAKYLETWLPRVTRFETLLAEAVDNNQMLETLDDVISKLRESEEAKPEGEKLQVRALFGAEDRLMDVELQKKVLKDTFANAEIFVEENAGHALPIHNGARCIELIKM